MHVQIYSDVVLELRRLSTKVGNLGDDFEDGIENVEDEIGNVGNEIGNLQDEVGDVEDEMAALKAEVQSLRSELQSGLANLQTSLGGENNTELENLRTQIESNVETIQELRSQLATFQNTTLHVLQELKGQLTATTQQLTDDAHRSSQERMEMKAALQTGITEVVKEVESTCSSSSQSGAQDIQFAVQYLPTSCNEVADLDPSSPSGYYRLSGSTGSAVNVYCDTGRHCCGSTGGWMRVAYLDITDPSQQCPSGFRLRSSPKRVCGKTVDGGCTSITFPAHNVLYSKVCGQVRAYQDKTPVAFTPYYRNPSVTIDGPYVEGVSITHGRAPRKHIWTFAAALDETRSQEWVCPCTKTDSPYTGLVPPFIGTDYFCDTGSRKEFEDNRFYHEDPLWDGEGCGPNSSCCQFNSPPWFCKELPQPTTDDIEVRVCSDNHPRYEEMPFELIELYLQ